MLAVGGVGGMTRLGGGRGDGWSHWVDYCFIAGR